MSNNANMHGTRCYCDECRSRRFWRKANLSKPPETREEQVLSSDWFGELEAAICDATRAETEANMQDDYQAYEEAGKDIGALRRTLEIMRRRSPNVRTQAQSPRTEI